MVVLLSQLCGPTLIPWRPHPGDMFILFLAWACAGAFVAYSARHGALSLALIAAFTQVLLIRYQYELRSSYGYETTTNLELIAFNVFVIAGYVLMTGGLGIALSRRWPARTKPAH